MRNTLFAFCLLLIGTLLINQRSDGSYIPKFPPGFVFMWGGSSCPTQSVALDGTSYLRAGTYAGLFAILSTTYGNADGTHFNVPNAGGAFIRGSGTQTISGLSFLGTRGTSQADQLQGHEHGINGLIDNNNGGIMTAVGRTVSSRPIHNYAALGTFSTQAEHTLDIIADGNGNSTPRAGAETRPANIVLLYCIAY